MALKKNFSRAFGARRQGAHLLWCPPVSQHSYIKRLLCWVDARRLWSRWGVWVGTFGAGQPHIPHRVYVLRIIYEIQELRGVVVKLRPDVGGNAFEHILRFNNEVHGLMEIHCHKLTILSLIFSAVGDNTGLLELSNDTIDITVIFEFLSRSCWEFARANGYTFFWTVRGPKFNG